MKNDKKWDGELNPLTFFGVSCVQCLEQWRTPLIFTPHSSAQIFPLWLHLFEFIFIWMHLAWRAFLLDPLQTDQHDQPLPAEQRGGRGQTVERHWRCHHQDGHLCPLRPQAQLPHLLPQPCEGQCLLWDPGVWHPAWQALEASRHWGGFHLRLLGS